MTLPKHPAIIVCFILMGSCGSAPANTPADTRSEAQAGQQVAQKTVDDLCQAEIGPGYDATGPASRKLAELRENADDWLSETSTPGFSATLIENHELQWSLICGLQEESVPATAETLYNTASIAKPIVGEIVLRLVARGDISLDEPMADHWIDPDIADDPHLFKLTPRIALSHQTGFRNWRRMSDGVLQFAFEPGSQTSYSGEGIRYVTRFIEAKLGQPFEDIARTVLFEPSGATSTSFVYRAGFDGRQAWRGLEDGSWAEPTRPEEPLGAGDIYTTGADYGRLLIAAMGNIDLDETSKAAQFAIQRDEVPRWCGPDQTPLDICPSSMGFSVGWYVYNYDDHRLLAHSGSNQGEKSLTGFIPDQGQGFVIFANGETAKPLVGQIARILYDNERFMTLEGY